MKIFNRVIILSKEEEVKLKVGSKRRIGNMKVTDRYVMVM